MENVFHILNPTRQSHGHRGSDEDVPDGDVEVLIIRSWAVFEVWRNYHLVYQDPLV